MAGGVSMSESLISRSLVSGSFALTGVMLLAVCSVAFSQTSSSQRAAQDTFQKNDPRAQGPSTMVGSETPIYPNDPCKAVKPIEATEILTDTRGVDFGPYMPQLAKTIRKSWIDLLPPTVFAPTVKQGSVAIKVVVQKDGKVDKIEVEESSGDVRLDGAALGSITVSSPLPPLPKEFPGENL